MTTTLAINTCCLDPEAGAGSSSGKKPYAQREFVLRNFIIPSALNDPMLDEVIVVGSWEDGPGYTYVPKPSIHFNCTDTLHQRQAAFEASHGDLVIFCHDDHLLDLMHYGAHFNAQGYMQSMGVDVLVPARFTRLRNVRGERLNSGEPGMWKQATEEQQVYGYIPGHCAIYTRAVIEKCPWEAVPNVFVWDTKHTAMIRAAEFNIEWTPMCRVWDVEQGSTPWQ